MTRVRDIAKILSVTETANTSNVALASIEDGVGLQVYATLDDLPTTGLTSGDQAYIEATNRIYISNGSGWYNVALINATPTLVIDPTGAITLATDGSTPTVITLTGTDSDNADANLTYSAESDGSFANIATLSQDSSVFTITPLSEANATPGSSTLTFKVSDGISFGSGTTTFTLSFVTIVENSNYTTLLAKADTATDNQVDASTNNHTITETGNVTSTALSPYHPGGYSTYFDGVNDYLGIDAGYITTNTTWWTSSGFTLEMWYYKTNTKDTQLWDNRQSGTTGFLFNSHSDGYHLYNNGSWQFQSVGTEKLNQWVHVALVINGTVLTLYEDGVSIHTDSVASTASYGYFGRTQNTLAAVQYTPRGGADEFAGYMHDVRISAGSRYTTTFTPPTEPHVNDSNTVLLIGSSPNIVDKSSNNHTITVFGNTSTKRFGPYDYEPYAKSLYGGSVYFDGASDYLSFTMTSDFTFAGDFTLECWFKPNSITLDTQHPNIIILGSYQLYVNSSSNFVGISPDGLSITLNSASQSINIGKWYHVAVVRSGTSEAMFLNGVRVATNTSSTNYGASSGTSFIGSYNGSGGDFNGYIADLRFVNGTAVYDPSQTTISTPTEPLTAIANTKLLTCTNKNDIWDAGSGALLTKAGDVTASNTQRQFTSSSAMYFDGTGDYLDITSLALVNGDFTIEFWMYATSIAGTQNIYDTRTGNGFTVNMVSGVIGFYSEPNSGYLLQSSALSADTWYHVAIVRNGTAMALYIDGTSVATATNSSSFTNTTGTIGARYSRDQQYYFGYLQDLRVLKGLAAYTANFTPPTEEFDA